LTFSFQKSLLTVEESFGKKNNFMPVWLKIWYFNNTGPMCSVTAEIPIMAPYEQCNSWHSKMAAPTKSLTAEISMWRPLWKLQQLTFQNGGPPNEQAVPVPWRWGLDPPKSPPGLTGWGFPQTDLQVPSNLVKKTTLWELTIQVFLLNQGSRPSTLTDIYLRLSMPYQPIMGSGSCAKYLNIDLPLLRYSDSKGSPYSYGQRNFTK
jgi:hypothetical protein